MALSMTLVSGGRAAAAICWWSAEESPVIPFAASELRSYLARMTGADLPVQQIHGHGAAGLPWGIALVPLQAGPAAPLPERLLAAAMSQVAGLRPDGFVIRAGAEGAVLGGHGARSVLYAAYELLGRLGVRFFAPQFNCYQGFAEHVPRLGTVVVPPMACREEPGFDLRRKYVEEGTSHVLSTLMQLIDWMAKVRLNVLVCPADYLGAQFTAWDRWRAELIPELARRGIVVEVGGHGYDSYLRPETYQDAHPEWFSPGCNVFCVDNEEALTAYISNVTGYLRARPEIQIFDAWPPDMAVWPPSAVERFGSIANAQAYVTNRLAEALRRTLPGVRVEIIAYVPGTDPPDPAYMYDPDVIVDFAPYDRSYTDEIFAGGPEINRYYAGLMRRWRQAGFGGRLALYEYYRKYSWRSLPVLLPALISREIPYWHGEGASGIGIYSEPADWIVYEAVHWLVAALTWNPGADGGRAVEEYLAERFGAAAPAMNRYLKAVEAAGRLAFDSPHGRWGDLGVVEQVRSLYLHAREALGQAHEAASGDTAAAWLIERLSRNAEYALADAGISYYSLQGESARAEEARQLTAGLVERLQFSGVMLANRYSRARWDPEVRISEPWRVFDLYRREWG